MIAFFFFPFLNENDKQDSSEVIQTQQSDLSELVNIDAEEILPKLNYDFIGIMCKLQEIPHGREYAYIYERYIFEAFKYIFEGSLKGGKLQVKLHNGKKRVDICFRNEPETKSFFYWLRESYRIFSPRIVVECKNYSKDIANDDLDQLKGRFNQYMGRFGILCCRKIEDKKLLQSRLTDIMKEGNRNYIMVLVDEDINKLLAYKKNNQDNEINELLAEKMDDIIYG